MDVVVDINGRSVGSRPEVLEELRQGAGAGAGAATESGSWGEADSEARSGSSSAALRYGCAYETYEAHEAEAEAEAEGALAVSSRRASLRLVAPLPPRGREGERERRGGGESGREPSPPILASSLPPLAPLVIAYLGSPLPSPSGRAGLLVDYALADATVLPPDALLVARDAWLQRREWVAVRGRGSSNSTSGSCSGSGTSSGSGSAADEQRATPLPRALSALSAISAFTEPLLFVPPPYHAVTIARRSISVRHAATAPTQRCAAPRRA